MKYFDIANISLPTYMDEHGHLLLDLVECARFVFEKSELCSHIVEIDNVKLRFFSFSISSRYRSSPSLSPSSSSLSLVSISLSRLHLSISLSLSMTQYSPCKS